MAEVFNSSKNEMKKKSIGELTNEQDDYHGNVDAGKVKKEDEAKTCQEKVDTALFENPSSEISDNVYKTDLRRHLLVHSGAKEFKCSLCTSEFKLKHNLERHMDAHMNGQSSLCILCPSGFTQKHSSDKHAAVTHDGNFETYSCRICDAVYKDERSLKAHIEVKHEHKGFSRQSSPNKHSEIHESQQGTRSLEFNREIGTYSPLVNYAPQVQHELSQTHYKLVMWIMTKKIMYGTRPDDPFGCKESTQIGPLMTRILTRKIMYKTRPDDPLGYEESVQTGPPMTLWEEVRGREKRKEGCATMRGSIFTLLALELNMIVSDLALSLVYV